MLKGRYSGGGRSFISVAMVSSRRICERTCTSVRSSWARVKTIAKTTTTLLRTLLTLLWTRYDPSGFVLKWMVRFLSTSPTTLLNIDLNRSFPAQQRLSWADLLWSTNRISAILRQPQTCGNVQLSYSDRLKFLLLLCIVGFDGDKRRKVHAWAELIGAFRVHWHRCDWRW